MLILSRKAGEKILIQVDSQTTIEVMPLLIDGGQVRLAINAPRHMGVWREEVAKRIAKEKKYEHQG